MPLLTNYAIVTIEYLYTFDADQFIHPYKLIALSVKPWGII